MKAMFLGFAAAIAIAIVAGVVLDTLNPSTAKVEIAGADVRL